MMTKNHILATALNAVDAGLSVIPVRLDGSKAPLGTWKEFQSRLATCQELEAWFSDDKHGIAIVAGRVSGNLEILDVEGKAMDAGKWLDIIDLAKSFGMNELMLKLIDGYIEYTPSGGLHILYRVYGDVPGNTKLARDPSLAPETDKGKDTIIETRGEGGYAIIAPTVDPNLGNWHIDSGTFQSIPTLTATEHEALHGLLKTFDQSPVEEETHEPPTSTRIKNDISVSVGDDFNAKTTWSTLLQTHGWTYLGKRDKIEYWRRPGKKMGVSATVGATASGNRLVVHSTSTPFKTSPSSYDLFGAYVLLEHKGNFHAATKRLADEGFGAQAQKPTSGSQKPAGEPELDEFGDPVEPPEPSTWEPIDWEPVLDGTYVTPKPEILSRTDGKFLFTPGSMSLLIAEPETGKSWLALQAIASELLSKRSTLMIDLEMTANIVADRLRSLGCQDEHIRQLVYIHPEMAPESEEINALIEIVTTREIRLTVFDSLGEWLVLLGLDENDSKDVRDGYRRLPKKFANVGACVLMLDHVTKDTKNRGKWAIGSQAKLAAVDLALFMDTKEPFAPGINGRAKLTVSKDRHSQVAAVSDHKKKNGQSVRWFADMITETTMDNLLQITLRSPADCKNDGNVDDMTSPTPVRKQLEKMMAIMEFLSQPKVQRTTNAIITAVAGDPTSIRGYLNTLANDGFIEKTVGDTKTAPVYWRYLKDYEEMKPT